MIFSFSLFGIEIFRIERVSLDAEGGGGVYLPNGAERVEEDLEEAEDVPYGFAPPVDA